MKRVICNKCYHHFKVEDDSSMAYCNICDNIQQVEVKQTVINKFIKTSENEFINIDFIVSLKEKNCLYYVTMANGEMYQLVENEDFYNLTKYIKNKKIEI